MNRLHLLSMTLMSSLLCVAAPAALGQTQDDERPVRQRDQDQNRDRDPRRGGQDAERPDISPRTPPPAPGTETPQRDSSQPQTDARKPDAAKPNASKPDAKTPAAGKPDAGDDADVAGGRMNPKAAQKKILLEEAKYRNQMARIARLRELATKQGNEQRLAALDKLEAKMTELHNRKIAAARASLGDQEFQKLNQALERGRGRGKGAGASMGRGKGNDQRPGNAPPGAGRGKPDDEGRGNAAREQDDRGKPDNVGRPQQSDDDQNNQSDSDRKGGGRPDNAGGAAAAGNRGGQNSSKGNGKGKP